MVKGEIAMREIAMRGTFLRCIGALAALMMGSVTPANAYSLLTTAWDPGTDTARLSAGNPAPGGATWSIMGAGITDGSGVDPHSGNATTDITGLLGGSSFASMATMFDDALSIWASVSDFTNLGQVTDSGAAIGASNVSGGHLGDIRIGAIYIDGSSGSNVLAHALNPCIEVFCGSNGSIGGDIHFDDSNSWVDDPNATTGIDLFTVALHEFGHALGLGHSDVVGSVMEATYTGARRALHVDDIFGIQAVYGASISPPPPSVPIPAAVWLFGTALGLLGWMRRKAK
jgi:hypothetical protein